MEGKVYTLVVILLYHKCFMISSCIKIVTFGGLFDLRLVGKLSPFAGMKHLDVAGGTG